MKTTIRIEDTRQPSLTRAVIRATGRDNLEDIARHGADAGFAGFTYYSDTVAFTKRHKTDIIARLREDCNEMGYESISAMLAGFRCLKNCKPDELAEALWNPKSELRTTLYNALAWYAAEEIARELNPEL